MQPERCSGSDLAVGYLPGFDRSDRWIEPGSWVACPGCDLLVPTYGDGVNVRQDEHNRPAELPELIDRLQRALTKASAA